MGYTYTGSLNAGSLAKFYGKAFNLISITTFLFLPVTGEEKQKMFISVLYAKVWFLSVTIFIITLFDQNMKCFVKYNMFS